jgi:hypothetical protein
MAIIPGGYLEEKQGHFLFLLIGPTIFFENLCFLAKDFCEMGCARFFVATEGMSGTK